MAFFVPSNLTNFGVDVVSSSKYPRSSEVDRNIHFHGYLCTTATAGVDIAKGSVLRTSLTVDNEVILSDVGYDKSVIGVAVESATPGKKVCFAIGGEFQVLVNGPVTRGDFLSASDAPGVAFSSGTGGDRADFAIATVSDASVGTRLITARFKKSEVF